MTSVQFGQSLGLSALRPQAGSTARQPQQASNVLFGSAGDRRSPEAIMKSRLLGIRQAVGKTLQVVLITAPARLPPESPDEAWNTANLSARLQGQDKRTFTFTSRGDKTSGQFELKSTDGQTAYRLEYDAVKSQVSGFDQRKDKAFSLAGNNGEELGRLALEIRKAIIDEIKTFKSKSPKWAPKEEEVQPDPNF